ncbi:hypothetical protein NIES2104_27730 [Leptolyngbya sp. NIES-2104]|nr:hypothetical protein NIES2104_27730 [Leptolyngbya sp. NIES-2104]
MFSSLLTALLTRPEFHSGAEVNEAKSFKTHPRDFYKNG